MKKKIIIGLTENLIIVKANKHHSIKARIDTGATKSSLDKDLAKKIGLGPTIARRMFKSAFGNSKRPIVTANIELAGKKVFKAEFSLADRSNMTYKALVGQDILKKGFLIDPSKTT